MTRKPVPSREFHRVEQQVRACCLEHGLFPREGTPVVCMVSGGCDSVALLRVICALREELSLGSILVVHVNHMIRGADADADEEFVRGLCLELGVELKACRVDVPALVEEVHGNLENVARQVRYRIAAEELDVLCDKDGVDRGDGRILVAHTASDRTETFFMRAIVGAGSGSLSSISYLNGRIARPLLGLTREDLEGYLHDLGAARWCEDATNADIEHFRAFVRAKIVPAARVFNPRLESTLGRTLDVLHDEDRYLSGLAFDAGQELIGRDSDGAVTIDAEGLLALPRALARRVVRDAVRLLLPEDVRLDNMHIERIVDGAGNVGFVTVLPTGLMVRNEYGTLAIHREPVHREPIHREPASSAARASGEKAFPPGASPCLGWLEIPGELALPGGRKIVSAYAADDADVRRATPDEAYVDVGVLPRLAVCLPRPGERMRPLGMHAGTKKVARVLIDEKVPARLRGNVVAVRTGDLEGDDIVWLAGIRTDDRYRVRDDSIAVVHLKLSRAGNDGKAGMGNGELSV